MVYFGGSGWIPSARCACGAVVSFADANSQSLGSWTTCRTSAVLPPAQSTKQKHPMNGCFYFGGSGWIRTSSGLSQQIYSLPRLSNSGARPIYGAGSGNRTRISSLEGLHTSLCTMPATNCKRHHYIPFFPERKRLFVARDHRVWTAFSP